MSHELNCTIFFVFDMMFLYMELAAELGRKKRDGCGPGVVAGSWEDWQRNCGPFQLRKGCGFKMVIKNREAKKKSLQ